MENHRYVAATKILIIAVTAFLLWPSFLLAYDDDTTHVALSDETVDFFNIHFSSPALNSEEKELVKKGSFEEDFAPRGWQSHPTRLRSTTPSG